MKQLPYIILVLSFFSLSAQQHQNLDNGFMLEGYDVVSYFSNKAEEGQSKFVYNYKGAKYKFASQAHLNAFKANPDKYVPQYGGFCAYAIAEKGEKVDVNPEAFEIRDGKLYLFYKTFFADTLKYWKEENPEQLVLKADKNWKKIKR